MMIIWNYTMKTLFWLIELIRYLGVLRLHLKYVRDRKKSLKWNYHNIKLKMIKFKNYICFYNKYLQKRILYQMYNYKEMIFGKILV